MAQEKTETRKVIGNALKQWIEGHYKNKTDFADILGVTPQYVSNLCAGKTIGKEMAIKMRNLFGLSPTFLLTGEGGIEISNDERKFIHDNAIAKANRFTQVLDYLVSSNNIENWMEISHRLNVTWSVIKRMTNYDPNGDYDKMFVKLCSEYKNISLVWLLTGEGKMLLTDTDEHEAVDAPAIDQSSLVNAALAAKDSALAAKDDLIKAKDELIDQLRLSLREKDQVIVDLRRALVMLQYNQSSDEETMKKHIVTHGLAEPENDTLYDNK